MSHGLWTMLRLKLFPLDKNSIFGFLAISTPLRWGIKWYDQKSKIRVFLRIPKKNVCKKQILVI